MEATASIAFLIFGLAFFIFCMWMVDSSQRRDRLHSDYRADLEYQRMLQERREFGYDRVEKAINSRPFYRQYKFK